MEVVATSQDQELIAPRRGRAISRGTLRRSAVLAYCLFVWLGCFHFYRLHNDFPIGYHPDEFSKVSQIIQDYRNFNHPLLLLQTTQKLLDFKTGPHDANTIVRTGRDASAALAATCAVGSALAGYFSAGWVGMILGSLAVGLCPSLLVYAHYMKEDASLLSGVGLTVAGMAWTWNRKTLSGQMLGPMLAGLGAAMAVSGKYVGATAITGALVVVLFAPFRRWWWIPIRLAVMAAIAIGAAALINHRGINQWQDFREGMDREYEHGTTDHLGVALPRPNHFMWRVAQRETLPHVKLFAIVLLLSVATLRKGFGGDLVLLLFAGGWLYVLSWNVIPFHRYGLPVVVMAHALAGQGAARAVGQLRTFRWLHLTAAILAIGVFAGFQGQRCRDFTQQFADDGRDRFLAWATANLPDNDQIAHDSYAVLSHRQNGSNGGQSVMFAPDNGAFGELRRNGIRYVVVCDSNYSRFFEPETSGSPGREYKFDYRKAWYERLFNEGKLIWQSKPKHPTYSFTNPEIRVYQLRGGQ